MYINFEGVRAPPLEETWDYNHFELCSGCYYGVLPSTAGRMRDREWDGSSTFSMLRYDVEREMNMTLTTVSGRMEGRGDQLHLYSRVDRARGKNQEWGTDDIVWEEI